MKTFPRQAIWLINNTSIKMSFFPTQEQGRGQTRVSRTDLCVFALWKLGNAGHQEERKHRICPHWAFRCLSQPWTLCLPNNRVQLSCVRKPWLGANNIMARAGGLILQGPLGREISKFFFCLPSSGDVKRGEDGLGWVMWVIIWTRLLWGL